MPCLSLSVLVDESLRGEIRIPTNNLKSKVRAAVPVNGTSQQVGVGQIDPVRALYLATGTAFIAKP